MAGSERGQDEANTVLWLDTRPVKMELFCPLEIAQYPRTIIHSKSI